MKAITLFILMSITGCATRVTTCTWGPDPGKNILKKTTVSHSWWLGLPAIAPMDSSVKDGEFQVETRAMKVPDGWFGVYRDQN